MSLSTKAVTRLKVATTDKNVGNEIANAVNRGAAAALAATHSIVGAIVATATSTTTDFGVLKVGDVVVHVPAAAGNAQFGVVATAGTAPFAAVVGDLYVVLRAISYPATESAGF